MDKKKKKKKIPGEGFYIQNMRRFGDPHGNYSLEPVQVSQVKPRIGTNRFTLIVDYFVSIVFSLVAQTHFVLLILSAKHLRFM